MKTKSAAVIGTPSLQRASGRMWYVSVNGGLVVNVTLETSRGRHVRPGPTSNGAFENLASDEPEGERSRSRGALVAERREAGGLAERPPVHDGPTHARRLRNRAACARDGEQARSERRG